MKASVLMIAALLVFSSCTKVVLVKTNPNGKMPPGQQKQATGSQSAKPYAPGQQKQGKSGSSAPGNSGNAPGQQKQKKK